MTVISVRVTQQEYLALKKLCEEEKTTVTLILKQLIQDRLVGKILAHETVNWKVNACNILGISIGQLDYALANSPSIDILLSRISNKSDTFTFTPLIDSDKVGLQCQKGDAVFFVAVKNQTDKMAVFRNLMREIEAKMIENVEDI